MTDEARYSIDELADLGGVSRRTVRYYVQERLLPAPLGVGRGRHYDDHHLDAIRRVKTMQEAGRSLVDIRADLAIARPPALAPLPAPTSWPAKRSTWRRFELAPGIELHLSSSIKSPDPCRLAELAAWCRQHFPSHTHEEPR